MLEEIPSKHYFNLFSFCFLTLSQKPGNYPVSFLPKRNRGDWEPHAAEAQEKLECCQTISPFLHPQSQTSFWDFPSCPSSPEIRTLWGFFWYFKTNLTQISCYPESTFQALSHHNWEFPRSVFLVAFTSVWIIISPALLFLQEPFQVTKPILRRILWHWSSSYPAVIPLEKASTCPPHV